MNRIGQSNYNSQYYERNRVENNQQHLKEASIETKASKQENSDSLIFFRRRHAKPNEHGAPIHKPQPVDHHGLEKHHGPERIPKRHVEPDDHGAPIRKPHPADHHGVEHMHKKHIKHDGPTYHPAFEKGNRARSGIKIDVHF